MPKYQPDSAEEEREDHFVFFPLARQQPSPEPFWSRPAAGGLRRRHPSRPEVRAAVGEADRHPIPTD